MYKLTRDHFHYTKLVTWEDIIHKLDCEFFDNTQKMIIGDEVNAPTFVMHNDYFPNSIGKAYEEVCEILDSEMCMHLYTSFVSNSNVFGMHKDAVDVLIVQSIGRMQYSFDDGHTCILNPGDSLFIEKGAYHKPTIIEPRATLSYSWVN